MTVARAFDRLDDGLKLDSAEVQAAKQCHHAIRDLLAAAGLIVGAFLQGSLARKTMVAPLRDVDMVVLIAPAHSHLRYAQGGSIEVMRLIHAALAAAYPEATFKVAKHASSSISARATSRSTSSRPSSVTTTPPTSRSPTHRRVAGSGRTRARLSRWSPVATSSATGGSSIRSGWASTS